MMELLEFVTALIGLATVIWAVPNIFVPSADNKNTFKKKLSHLDRQTFVTIGAGLSLR